MRLFPHFSASEDAVEWRPWRMETPQGDTELGEFLDAWDYAQPLNLVAETVADLPAIQQSAQLDSSAALGVAATWDCAATAQSETTVIPVDGQTLISRLHVPHGQVAKDLNLFRELVLLAPGHRCVPPVPSKPATRLGPSHSQSVTLEGARNRFPVTPTSFRDLGRPAAAWSLDVNYVGADDSFAGTVQLLVNTDHPAASRILEPDPAGDLASLIKVDMVRQLLAFLAADIGPTDLPDDPPEASVASVAEGLCQNYLSQSLSGVLADVQNQPLRFAERLQEGFRLLHQE